MQIEDGAEALGARAARLGLAIDDLDVDAAIALVVGWVRDDPCEDADPPEADGDLVLVQWSTSARRSPLRPAVPTFQLDLTRQLARSDPSGGVDLWQHSLTLHHRPDAASAAAGGGNRWWVAPADLDAMQGWLSDHPAVVAVRGRRPLAVDLASGPV